MSSIANRRRATKAAPADIAGAADRFSLAAFVPYRLAVLSSDVSRALGATYGARFDLKIADWRILANLAHWGSMPAGTLAARSNLDKPKVTRAIQRLVARGYITRKVVKTDRRTVAITLTSRGRQMHAATAATALAWEAELLSVLSSEQRKSFLSALDALAIQARRLSAPGEPE